MLSPRVVAGRSGRRLPLVLVALGLLGLLGCASDRVVRRVSDRTYSVTCRGPLANCLVPVQEICVNHGYDVLSATERREYVGPSPEASEIVNAQATVRCREATPLFGSDPNLPVVPSCAASANAPAPASASPVAVPPAPPVPSAAAPAAPPTPAVAPPTPDAGAP